MGYLLGFSYCIQELEKKEAEENGGGDVESILPGGAIKNKDKKRLSSGELQGREFSSFTREGYDELHGQMSHYSGYLQSVGGGPGEGPEPIIDPRLAIDSDQCNSTGKHTHAHTKYHLLCFCVSHSHPLFCCIQVF